jgi:hypothetical protein
MQWSEVDKLAKRNSLRQCLSDWGMHRDADDYFSSRVLAKAQRRSAKVIFRARSNKDKVAALGARARRVEERP